MFLVTLFCLFFIAIQAQPRPPPPGNNGPPPPPPNNGPPPPPPNNGPPPPPPNSGPRPPPPPPPPFSYPPTRYTTRPTTTQGPYRPPTTPCSLYPYPGSPSSPCYVATNSDMQTAIANTASVTSNLARVGRDYSSNNLLRQISNALQSIQYLYYDYVTLIMLSPAIAQMKAASTSASYYCRQQPVSPGALSNLGQNLVFWTNNGRNPSPQQVMNLFNTASQFLQQYC
ncbi:hypothetical protein V3C99_002255 [Haemonchus contortus]